jgi:integrase
MIFAEAFFNWSDGRSMTAEQSFRIALRAAHFLSLQTPETLVFDRNGQPRVPNTFTTAFMRALDAGFRHVRLHDLRHTFATLLLKTASM